MSASGCEHAPPGEAKQWPRAETAKRGPRHLTVWIHGNMSGTRGKRNLFDYVEWTLARSICLTLNKAARTLSRIAEQVQAHEWYVQQTVGRLLHQARGQAQPFVSLTAS